MYTLADKVYTNTVISQDLYKKLQANVSPAAICTSELTINDVVLQHENEPMLKEEEEEEEEEKEGEEGEKTTQPK